MPPISRFKLVAAIVVLIAILGFGIAALVGDPHEIAGALPAAPAIPVEEDVAAQVVPAGEWRAYGRTAFGQRYSPLTDITPDNVAGLREVWRYRSGGGENAQLLKAGWRIYLCASNQSVIALHPTNGIQLWRRDIAKQRLTCPGVAFQPPFSEPVIAGGECGSKIFMPAADGRLLVMDTETGAPCPTFGGKGEIDLWADMPKRRPGSASPIVLTKKLAIAGGASVIRAFDIDTGAPMWTWDSGVDSPNRGSVASFDEALGIVYVPMGKSLIALDLNSGKVRWTFPALATGQPTLADLAAVPALVQPTEKGELVVLDRRTGKPMMHQIDVAKIGGLAVDPQRGIAFVVRSSATPTAYVAGVDLASGKIAWRHRAAAAGMPMITAGGVAFLAAAQDSTVRAYDVTTGRLLWESRLPARGQGTPITYTGDENRQFVAVTAGDYVIAYALPKK